jgi:hypothetical protein
MQSVGAFSPLHPLTIPTPVKPAVPLTEPRVPDGMIPFLASE